jgi:hypothetical protein
VEFVREIYYHMSLVGEGNQPESGGPDEEAALDLY